VECDKNNYGCNGGYLDKAWNFFEVAGVVTEQCLPYVSGGGVSPACATTCANPAVAYEKYKCVAGSRVECTSADCIKKEISTNGPMETGFDVYQDFFSYAGGVY
jgi:cathepsin B